jgi:hypothetical protein
MINENPFVFGGIIGLAANGLIGLIISTNVKKLLSDSYPEIAESVGASSPFNNSIGTSLAFLKLVFFPSQEIEQKSIMRLLVFLRIIFIIQVSLLAALVVFGVFAPSLKSSG